MAKKNRKGPSADSKAEAKAARAAERRRQAAAEDTDEDDVEEETDDTDEEDDEEAAAPIADEDDEDEDEAPVTRVKAQTGVAQQKKIKTTKLQVVATRLGYYELERKRPGDAFTMEVPVSKGKPVLPSWVVLPEEFESEDEDKQTKKRSRKATSVEL